MLIYAFYSLGKTYYCEHHPEAVDLDEQYFWQNDSLESYYKAIKENEGKVIFINSINIPDRSRIDLAFIPSDIDFVAKRLRARGVNEAFIENILYFAPEILSILSTLPNKIVVTEDKYISDYEDIIKKKIEEHP